MKYMSIMVCPDDVLRAILCVLSVLDWREAAAVDIAARSLAVSMERIRPGGREARLPAGHRAYVARIDLRSWDFDTPRCELGYIGDSRVAGPGLVREAALAMIDLAWSLGVERVQALVDGRNTRAMSFATALGMSREGVLRRYERDADGALCDQVMFAILRPAT